MSNRIPEEGPPESLLDESPADKDKSSTEIEKDTSAQPSSRGEDGPRGWTQMSIPGDHDFDENNAHVHLVVNEWAGGTSIHGVASISDFVTYKLWKRMLWLVLVVGSASLMVWQIESLIRQYTNYEVITDTETIVPGHLDFPEITVCNVDPLSASLMNETGIDDPQTEDELDMVTPPVGEFILTATFNEQELNQTEEDFVASQFFKKRVTPEGICWSFNASDLGHRNGTILKPGSFGGLFMLLYIDQDNYRQNYSDLAGVTVYAQQPGTEINDELPFLSASPGRMTIAKMRLTDFVREKELPWARCKGDAPTYTQPYCRDACVNKVLRERCGCRYYHDNAAPNMTYCTPENDDCVDKFELEEEPRLLEGCSECDLPPCTEKTYDMTSDSLDFSQKLLEFFDSLFGITEETPEAVKNELRGVFLNNLVAIQINYDKIQFDLLTESKAVSLAQLLGSIGGSMGLFLGISALSVFEVFGDLAAMRLIPRLFGYRNLHGLGARSADE